MEPENQMGDIRISGEIPPSKSLEGHEESGSRLACRQTGGSATHSPAIESVSNGHGVAK